MRRQASHVQGFVPAHTRLHPIGKLLGLMAATAPASTQAVAA